MAKSRYYKRPDGLYETIRKIDGKRVAFRGATCKEVDQKILEYKVQAEKGRKFPVVADEWQKEHAENCTESTRRVYSYSVQRLSDAFPGYIRDLRPIDIKRYITAFEKEGRSVNSVQIELSVCKQIFSHAVLVGDIDVSPATEVKKSRGLPCKKRNALTMEQEDAVKEAGRSRSAEGWLFGLLLLYTGCRRGEALALSYNDIDRAAGVIHIEKKLSYAYGQNPVLENHLKSENGRRDIPLLGPLADALPRDRAGLIFPGKDGGFMRASEIYSMWKKYCRAIGLNEIAYSDSGKILETFPVTPHCFRHSFATICYEAGLDPRETAHLLGDTMDVTEAVYVQLREQRREKASDKLERFVSQG